MAFSTDKRNRIRFRVRARNRMRFFFEGLSSGSVRLAATCLAAESVGCALAEASGSRPRRPAAPAGNLRGSPQIRRIRELQSMVPNSSLGPAEASGSRPCRLAAATGCRPRRPAAPAGNLRGSPQIRRIRELQSMVPEFVARPGGSRWPSALPTRLSLLSS